MTVADLPSIWNQKMKDYLGVELESDAKGCLQDVHWSAGLFGYFPTYTLGTLMAQQLYKRLQQEFSDLDNMIRDTQFIPIKTWLNKHIHQHGCRFTVEKLIVMLGNHNSK